MRADPAAVPRREALLAKAAHWPRSVAAAVTATPADRLIPIAIHGLPVPKRLAVGRTVAVGDAAHAMEPNLGQGACQALEDAVALGRIAARVAPADVAAAFNRARRPRVAAMMRRAAEGGRATHGPAIVRAAWRSLFRVTPVALHRRLVDGLYRMPAY